LAEAAPPELFELFFNWGIKNFSMMVVGVKMKKIATMLILFVLGGCASHPLGLNEQIVLNEGDTKQVGPDGFEITLRSLSDASGCLSPDDCSTMMFDGTIVARLGEKSMLNQVQVGMKPGQVVSLDIDGYLFQLTGVRHGVSNKVQAIFIVLGKK
jgi:hypothetical protein